MTPADPTSPPGTIVTRGLRRTYGDVEAVQGLDLTVAQGELFAFLGPNGAGKSTTIGMLCTTLRPTTGHAQVAGADITRSPHDVRRQIGVVFQESTTDDDLTAQENLRLYADLYGIYLYSARLLSVLGCPCLPLVCRHTPNDIDSHFARSDVPVSCSYALNLSESQAAGDGPAGRVGGIVMDLDAVDAQGRVVQVMCPG